MKRRVVRTWLGLGIFFAQFALLAWIFIWYVAGGFDLQEWLTTTALIAPMFAAHTVAIVKSFLAESGDSASTVAEGQIVTTPVLLITATVPALYVLFVFVLVLLKAMNLKLSRFDDFKLALGTAQTVFGGYLGYLIASFFGEPKSEAGG